MKVYIREDMSKPVYRDGELIGYIEYTEGGLRREIPVSDDYEIVLVKGTEDKLLDLYKLEGQPISIVEAPLNLTKDEYDRLKQLYKTNKSNRYRVPKGRGQYPATEPDALLPRLIRPEHPGSHSWKDYDVIEIKEINERA